MLQKIKYIAVSEKSNKKVSDLFFNASVFGLMIIAVAFYIGFVIAPQGRDYSNYESFYKSLSTSYGGVDSGERFEPGFKFLSILISFFFANSTQFYFTLLVFVSLFTKWIVVVKYLRLNYLKMFIFFIFYSYSFLLVFEVNQIREAIAISFGFLSFYYFYKNEKLLTVFNFLLAFSFHYTSIIYLIGYLAIYYIKKRGVNFVLISITALAILSKFAIAVFEKINPIAGEYRRNYDGVTFGLTNITFLLALVFFIYHYINVKKEDVLSTALLMFLYFGIIFYLVINDIPVYQIRILELTEVSCLLIGLRRKFTSYYDYGSAFLMTMIILHKFIAYIFVNPLYG